MTPLLRLSSQLYGAILRLYPSELRRDFGPEMAELFREDLGDAWSSRGAAGVLRVWWCALCEVMRIAVPAQRTNPAFVVPAISFVLSVSMQCGTLLTIRHALARESPEGLLLLLLCAVALPSLATATTAVVVVHTGKASFVSLGLNSADDGTLCSKSAI